MKYELFNVRNKQDFDKYYPMLKSWWEGKGGQWQSIRPEFLSSRGMIIKDKDKYTCAAWLYTTDSAYGVVNWVISNNDSSPKDKKKCIEFMLNKLQDYAKFIGIKTIYMAMETRSLKKILSNQGFLMTSNNISEFFKVV